MQNYPNLYNISTQTGNESASRVLEILSQSNPINEDIPWIPCNSGVTHVTTIRTGIPTGTWRMLNRGVPNVKSSTAQIKAGCAIQEAYSEVDAELVEIARGNGGDNAASSFIANENTAVIEGFGQEIARVSFYGDPSKPAEPVGLCHYYNALPTAAKETNVIDGGGTGNDNTSIWLVGWGERSIHGIYPAGTNAGMTEDAKGIVTTTDPDGNKFEVYRTHYRWRAGLVVRDWRCAVRIANIDCAAIDTAINGDPTSGVIDVIKSMTRASYLLPTSGSYRPVFYCRREILTLLDLQCQKKSNLHLTYQDIAGKPVLTFRGIPIKQQDSLLNTESAVK